MGVDQREWDLTSVARVAAKWRNNWEEAAGSTPVAAHSRLHSSAKFETGKDRHSRDLSAWIPGTDNGLFLLLWRSRIVVKPYQLTWKPVTCCQIYYAWLHTLCFFGDQGIVELRAQQLPPSFAREKCPGTWIPRKFQQDRATDASDNHSYHPITATITVSYYLLPEIVLSPGIASAISKQAFPSSCMEVCRASRRVG